MKYIERVAYGSVAAPNDIVIDVAPATVVVVAVALAAVVVDAVVVVAVATVADVVVVVIALAAAPNEVNDDAAVIAIGTTIAARVAPSSKPHKNAATLKSSSFLILESKASPAILCEGQTTQPVIAPFVS